MGLFFYCKTLASEIAAYVGRRGVVSLDVDVVRTVTDLEHVVVVQGFPFDTAVGEDALPLYDVVFASVVRGLLCEP